MDTSRSEASPTQSSTEGTPAPIRLAFDADAKKHFDNFESHFFQQGEDDNLPGAYDAYEDPESRIKRWLPYRVLLGISIASTTVAMIACVALLRHTPAAPVDVHATPSFPAAPAVPAPVAVAVATAPAPAVAAEPAPGVAAAPVPAVAPVPTPALAAVPSPTAAEPSPTAAPAASAPIPAVAVATAGETVPAKAAEPVAPAVALAEEAKADTEKAKAEAPAPAAAPPAENEARTRCRQSIHDRRAKDIVAVCTAAFEQDTTDTAAAVAVAKVEFDRGRFTQAYNWSKKAIAVDPSTADAYVYAGGAEQNQGHGKAAKEAYLQYLRLAPSGRYAAELRTIVNSL